MITPVQSVTSPADTSSISRLHTVRVSRCWRSVGEEGGGKCVSVLQRHSTASYKIKYTQTMPVMHSVCYGRFLVETQIEVGLFLSQLWPTRWKTVRILKNVTVTNFSAHFLCTKVSVKYQSTVATAVSFGARMSVLATAWLHGEVKVVPSHMLHHNWGCPPQHSRPLFKLT